MMKARPLLQNFSALSLVCLLLGALSLPAGAQVDTDRSSEKAPSESDSLDASDWTAQWIGRNNSLVSRYMTSDALLQAGKGSLPAGRAAQPSLSF